MRSHTSAALKHKLSGFFWAEEMVEWWLGIFSFINHETEAGESMHFLNIMPLREESD